MHLRRNLRHPLPVLYIYVSTRHQQQKKRNSQLLSDIFAFLPFWLSPFLDFQLFLLSLKLRGFRHYLPDRREILWRDVWVCVCEGKRALVINPGTSLILFCMEVSVCEIDHVRDIFFEFSYFLPFSIDFTFQQPHRYCFKFEIRWKNLQFLFNFFLFLR